LSKFQGIAELMQTGVHLGTSSRFEDQQTPKRSPVAIEKRVWIRATAEVVFRALTDSKELARWFCDRAISDPRDNGEFVAHWTTGKSTVKGRAVFTRIVKPSSVELLWIDDGKGEQPGISKHTLRYEIRTKSEMTEVFMLDQDENVPDEDAFEILDQGWNTVLLELKDFCERRQRSIRLRPHGTKAIASE
jgi:uncharacterized protein YndB with AHSA1/START domain